MGVDTAALARRYMNEIFAKGKLDAIDELVGDNIELKDPMTPHGVRGKDALRERVREMSRSFSDAEFDVDEVIVAGDRVIMRQTWRGKHTGDFMGLRATGKTVSCLACDILRIEDGKVVENISYFDVYEMLQQLGLLPPPGAAPAGAGSAAAPAAPAPKAEEKK